MRWVAFIALATLMPALVQANPQATAALNTFRAEQSRAALDYDLKLERAAEAHAKDMASAGFFDHTGSDGSNVGQRVQRAGYRWCHVAENIAKGQRDLDAVMTAWAKSQGHRRNMLSRKAEAFALYEGRDKIWVMVLAAPC